MSKLIDLIREHDTGDPAMTADAVFDALNCPQKWRELFWGVVHDECRRHCRASTRSLELASGKDRTPTGTTGAATTIASASRSAFLRSGFYTGVKNVTWGEATVEDHLARIEFLESFRRGLAATIERHRAAIDTIEAAGASCLDEIEAVAA